MNKPIKQDALNTSSEQFVVRDRIRLFTALTDCERQLKQSQKAHQETKMTYQLVVVLMVIMNLITYGALLYVRYSQTPFM